MSLPRRNFLRLSAFGAVSLVLPLASVGCGSPAVGILPDVHAGGDADLLFFDTRGRRVQLQPLANRVLVHAAEGGEPVVLGRFGMGAGQLNGPTSLALGPDERVYVVDRGNARVQVFTRSGAYLGQLGRSGTGEGELAFPYGVAVAADGSVWVSDTLNHRLQRFEADGRALGAFAQGLLETPRGLAIAPDGYLHVVEGGSGRIAVVSPEGVVVSRYGGREDGLLSPRSIVAAADGCTYVTDVTAAVIFAFAADGRLRERIQLTRDGLPAAPVHAALTPSGVLEVATVPAAAAA
ncbi:hypothetical protein FGE12_01115 [Aggregicoccus sp. 17bor-14]|uniref:NHL repeat-containing protein n=1 Tax=Myxococcaceae TaxID=31 RepID=UPI00129CF264|nr:MULTISPECIES: NHL repeat-containing protein [Myxococcaceae]MBF5040973.1 NHL repeat-containing protein [Simulacricoccus sp. 17bor-14]MRI86761.1 hypothetical protein [Aggregicoccus sp. 17bor-14]